MVCFKNISQLCKTTPVSYTQTVIPLIKLTLFNFSFHGSHSLKCVCGSTLGDRTPTNSEGVCVTCNLTDCRKFTLICPNLCGIFMFICVINMCNMCNYVYICAYVDQICIIMHFQYYKCINRHIM